MIKLPESVADRYLRLFKWSLNLLGKSIELALYGTTGVLPPVIDDDVLAGTPKSRQSHP